MGKGMGTGTEGAGHVPLWRTSFTWSSQPTARA